MFELYLTDWMYDLKNPSSLTLETWQMSVLEIRNRRIWAWPQVIAALKM
jgi:hypothetical protein